mmetsp:Transcript_2898/g.4237  ORF Transcript_2898/g.4237 Transcript_2898/m.4237 type:complete len:279 (+) Transcript_2898:38-874(+)
MEGFDDLDLEEDVWFCKECPVKVKNSGPDCILCGAPNTNESENNIEEKSSAKWTSMEQKFHQDAKDGEVENVIAHVSTGMDVNCQDPHGETALMKASYWGQTEVIEQLVEAKADINHIAYKEGWTALMRASKSSRADAVRILIKAGADVTIMNHQGQRAFDVAGAFDGSESMPIKRILSAELHRWVSAHLKTVCKLPVKAAVIVLQYHCPEFYDEVARAKELKRLKDSENQHKTDDKDDASADARRRQEEQKLRREYGRQMRSSRTTRYNYYYDDDYY